MNRAPPQSQVEIPKLEPKHLFQKRQARDSARLRAYNQLLEQIHNRIYSTSQLPGNPLYVIYTVPPFILGLPSMDLQDCVVYLVHQLRSNGFEVRFTYPNLLYISWKQFEREYMLKSNPIAQAMVAATPPPAPKQTRAVKKETPGVRFTLPPQVDTAGNLPAAPRAARDYVPPDSFLNTMQRPAAAPRPAGGPGSKQPTDVLAELWKFA
jgi:Family of unknown function (DUF5759)